MFNNIPKRKIDSLIEMIKFAIVGIANNAIYYVVYLALDLCGCHYILSNIIAFSVSVVNAYFWNNKYVFVNNKKRPWIKTFIKTYISYATTGIVLSNILLYIWVEVLLIPQLIAPLINLVITVPINFIVNKLWAFK